MLDCLGLLEISQLFGFQGIINFGVAENTLCEDLLTAKVIMDSFELNKTVDCKKT